jgi:hypothetical protein
MITPATSSVPVKTPNDLASVASGRAGAFSEPSISLK